jgi:hypothetical protein
MSYEFIYAGEQLGEFKSLECYKVLEISGFSDLVQILSPRQNRILKEIKAL